MQATQGTSHMRERWIPGHFSFPTWPGYEARQKQTSDSKGILLRTYIIGEMCLGTPHSKETQTQNTLYQETFTKLDLLSSLIPEAIHLASIYSKCNLSRDVCKVELG